jgi:hypothetical protein
VYLQLSTEFYDQQKVLFRIRLCLNLRYDQHGWAYEGIWRWWVPSDFQEAQNLLHFHARSFCISPLKMQNPLDSIGHGRSGSCTIPHSTADLRTHCNFSVSNLKYFALYAVEYKRFWSGPSKSKRFCIYDSHIQNIFDLCVVPTPVCWLLCACAADSNPETPDCRASWPTVLWS